jgi:hypothetical protein
MHGVATSPYEPTTSRALAPYRAQAQPGLAAGGEGGLGRLVRGAAAGLDGGEPGGATRAAVVELSDLAQRFLDQVRSSGATSGTFDLHLDLEQLGLRIDGRGQRSAEGHSLSIDLHVETHRGVVETENGAVAFEQLELSFSIEEMHVRIAEAPGGGRSGDATAAGDPPAPGRALTDALKELASLLDRATEGAERRDLELDDLRERLAEHGAELLRLLERLGHAFEALRRRSEDAAPAEAVGAPKASGEVVAFAESTEVRLEALRFVRADPRQVAENAD